MLQVGKCACGYPLEINDTYYDHTNFEGHVFCRNCQRLYYMEIKNHIARLGRCFKILKRFVSPATAI